MAQAHYRLELIKVLYFNTFMHAEHLGNPRMGNSLFTTTAYS